jgi:hypothetical protein
MKYVIFISLSSVLNTSEDEKKDTFRTFNKEAIAIG